MGFLGSPFSYFKLFTEKYEYRDGWNPRESETDFVERLKNSFFFFSGG